MIKDQMNKIYKDIDPDKIPWNIETPPEILQTLTRNNILRPCKLIELGCGAGNYVIYFSKIGFDATGVDISENAIEIARKSVLNAGIKCNFVVADVLGDMSEIKDKYDFAYDWELLHHISPDNREKYVNNVYRLLNPEGRYLSVCFSEDSVQFGGAGKYRRTPT
jgi:cyclopropane fatty-acyl-phospholipid synthase-like methyltransferase